MKLNMMVKTEGITEGRHNFKIVNIKPLTYSEDTELNKRIPKVIIQGLVDGKILHSIYALNEHKKIDGLYTQSMYDKIIVNILSKLNIEVSEDFDTEDYDTINILLHGKEIECYALNNKADNGKTYCNITFAKTDKYLVWEKLQMLQ